MEEILRQSVAPWGRPAARYRCPTAGPTANTSLFLISLADRFQYVFINNFSSQAKVGRSPGLALPRASPLAISALDELILCLCVREILS
jgi:hypothetical protein